MLTDNETRAGPATIRDVAARAGVSHMTVSRVMNGDARVRPETRAAVQSAIRELRYTPNSVARALSKGVHHRLALLHRFPNLGTQGEFLVHLLAAARDHHVDLAVLRVSSALEDGAVVNELRDTNVRAVILAAPLAHDTELVSMLREQGIALVAVGAARAEMTIASVRIDDQAAAASATRHLIALGHRRIGFIKGDPAHASTMLRLNGYREALEEAKLPFDPGLIASGAYTYRSGLDAAEQLLGLPGRPSAIFASNDDMAAATMAVAHRQGLVVPSQLSVCGFDDTEIATTIWPALTTVRQPIQQITAAAIDLAVRQLAGDASAGAIQQVFEHSVVSRESDGPPA